MIINCHGNYTTTPEPHQLFREAQMEAYKSGKPFPKVPQSSDDQISESVERNQLRLLRERDIDMTVFLPRASGMDHHLSDRAVFEQWTAACNNLIKREVNLYPDYLIGVCQLPQSQDVSIEHSVAELECCVNELGFVGCNLNPDPSDGHWTSELLIDRSWYLFHEKMVDLDVPTTTHASGSCNYNFHATWALSRARGYAQAAATC
jgi:4-oxalmesaconate hydratase